MTLRGVIAALLVALTAVAAQGQRRLFSPGGEGDRPERSWVIAEFGDSAARAMIESGGGNSPQGIWQATADGTKVAFIPGKILGHNRVGESLPGGAETMLLVVLDANRPGVRSGTVLGWATPAATPQRWDAWIFTQTDGRELTSPRRYQLISADESHLSMKPAGEGFRIALWKMVPYFFRSALRETAPPEGLDGFLRLWPAPTGTPPLQPVHL